MTNRYKAEVVYQRGNTNETYDSYAEKKGGAWFVGGDCAKSTTENGGKIFITIEDRIYWLKGNRLIFQDNTR